MEYKNGYKVVYEVAANGERTFWASKSNEYPARDEAGNIIENEMNTKLASFKDEDFRGKTIYEYKGEFYVSEGSHPAYNEDGSPKSTETKLDFSKVLEEEEPEEVVEETEGQDAGDDGQGNEEDLDTDGELDEGDAE